MYECSVTGGCTSVPCSATVEDHEMLICIMQNAYMFCPILIHTRKLQYLHVYTLEQKSCHYKRYECIFLGGYCTMLSVTLYVGSNGRMIRTWLIGRDFYGSVFGRIEILCLHFCSWIKKNKGSFCQDGP